LSNHLDQISHSACFTCSSDALLLIRFGSGNSVYWNRV